LRPFLKYTNLIFDFDGVILDSNNIKKFAIREAAKDILVESTLEEFVEYFTKYNGIPRETKISKFIPKIHYNYVLQNYERLINKELCSANLTEGVEKFIEKLYLNQKSLYVLSGGKRSEVIEILKNKDLYKFFKNIYGGPEDKYSNILNINLDEPTIFFGDSFVDYKLSLDKNIDFCFIYGYSNITNFKDKIKEWQIKFFSKNFTELNCYD